MSRCLKCNYELAFLERRHKYKCAKCSSLFTEEEIKLEEFKKYNKARRDKEKEEVKKEVQILIKNSNKKLSEEEKREKKKEIMRKWREEHREEYNHYKRKYWAEHRERLLARRKDNINTGKQNEVRKLRRTNDIETTRINGRIEYWKRRQKVMAESRFDEFLVSRTSNSPKKILPTFVLA